MKEFGRGLPRGVLLATLVLASVPALATGAAAQAPEDWALTLSSARFPGDETSPEALASALAAADAHYGLPPAPGGAAFERLGPEGLRSAVHLRFPTGESRGTLVFVHGYQEHGLSAPALVRAALDSGWTYAGLDLPGHGASPGERGWVDDFSGYGAAVGALLDGGPIRRDRPVLVVGFSTGGAAIVEFLSTLPTDTPARTEGFLLLSPLVRIVAWWPSRLGLLLAEWAMPRLPGRTVGMTHDKGWKRRAARDPLRVGDPPSAWMHVLVRWEASLAARAPRPEAVRALWGGSDTVVNSAYGRRSLSRLFPAASHAEIRGAYHGLPFEGGDYLEAVLAELREAMDEAAAGR
ncbi:MAG: alpha/beta hydrolase [Spirochaetales bacterium]|nr:alpha/beta hydrolase [Spirochaetales bacterium]